MISTRLQDKELTAERLTLLLPKENLKLRRRVLRVPSVRPRFRWHFQIEIDPFRRGQDATIVAQNERTTSEKLDATIEPLDDLVAGQPFRVQTSWSYSRVTDKSIYQMAASEVRTNTHIVKAKKLVAPSRVSRSITLMPLRAILSRADGTGFSGAELYVSVGARPPNGQGGEFRLILSDSRNIGVYTGEFNLREACAQIQELGEKCIGTWNLYLMAQNVNLAPPGLSPTEAAKTIGGSVVVSPIAITLSSEVCPMAVPDAQVEVYA